MRTEPTPNPKAPTATVLELLSRAEAPLTTAEIAARLGYRGRVVSAILRKLAVRRKIDWLYRARKM